MDEKDRAEQLRYLRDRRLAEIDTAQSEGRLVVGRNGLYRAREFLVDEAGARSCAAVGGITVGGPAPAGHWRLTSEVPLEADPQTVDERLEPLGLRLAMLTDDRATAVEAVAEVRRRTPPTRTPGGPRIRTAGAHLNHVLSGEPVYQGGPGGPPSPADPLAEPTGTAATDLGAAPDIAVLDTGVAVGVAVLHPGLASVVEKDADDTNLLFEESGLLATEGGHGTFVCGLVHRLAPTVRIDPGRVLSPAGFGDDATISAELLETVAPVVNLSLGGYTEDGGSPPALTAAIHQVLSQGRVVVAAAGNDASDALFYPAAVKGVLAVGAYDSSDPARPVAAFSNGGYWVDVWAPGVGLRSAYVQGTYPSSDTGTDFDGYAAWSGTSFAAPLVATEIARRYAAREDTRLTPREIADAFLDELPRGSYPGGGRLYTPPLDLTR